MLQQVIQYVNIKLQTLNLFTKSYELAEMISKKDGEKEITFPAVKDKTGEYKEIDFDKTPSLCFHIVNGDVSRQTLESITVTKQRFQHDIPIRLFCVIEKKQYKNWSAYTAYTLSQNISTTITETNVRTLKVALKIHSCSITPTTCSIDSEQVYKEIFKGVDVAFPDDVVFIAVNYTISIIGTVNCVPIVDCEGNEIDIETILRSIICSPVKIYNFDGTLNDTIESGGSYTLPNTNGDNMKFINFTLPASGTNIVDADDETTVIGTRQNNNQITITELASYVLNDFHVFVNETPLSFLNVDDSLNMIDVAASINGIIKLLPGRNLFQRGTEVRILLKTN